MAKIDINLATINQLKSKLGLSDTVAKNIVKTRNRVGRFNSLDDIQAVAGVTEEHLNRIEADTVIVLKTEGNAGGDKKISVLLDAAKKHVGAYGGYKVTANYKTQLIVDEQNLVEGVTGSTTGYSNIDGRVELTLPAIKLLEGGVHFEVKAPTGESVNHAEFSPAEIKVETVINTEPLSMPVTSRTQDASFGKPSKLRGRVLDQAGRIEISNKQVIIWASKSEEPTPESFIPILATQTDRSGYFSASYPLDKFTLAHANVAMEGVVASTIHLNDDGTFPENIILAVEVPALSLNHSEESDCGCGGGGAGASSMRNPDAQDLVNGTGFSADAGHGKCVDFTRPDRTLQEFSYSYVVRTTEPSIKGMTLDEPPKLPPHIWREFVGLSKIAANNRSDIQVEGLSLRSAVHEDFAAESFMPEADIVKTALNRADKLDIKAINEVGIRSKFNDLIRIVDGLSFTPERSKMDCNHPVDWDLTPTIYQACTIAHGHILHFKQEWIADGYSMGKLLYSLPLAPGQKKQIAVLDWERRESAVRQESLDEQESLVATLSRDRDIGEMVNSVLSESSRGGSSANTGSVGGGLGIGAILGPVGGLLGIGGGYSSASSNAWQNSSRNVAANSLQTLSDRTSQAAAAMRSQRSTVIQTVSQGERVSVVTETVANYNHCHAMTVEYFEVLRHMIVRQRLTDVQECLFVPLQMSPFDRAKALRWRHTLQSIMPTRDLRAGFDALERIDNHYDGSDLPVGTYADQTLEYVEGDLSLRFQLARPRDKDDDFEPSSWTWLSFLIPSLSAQEQYKTFLKDQHFKDRIFLEQLGPRIARAFVDLLQFSWIDENDVEHALPIDTTLLSNFVNDSPLSVSLRINSSLIGIPRARIKFIKISEFTFGGIPLFNVLPANSRVIVESGNMTYRTKFAGGYLFNNGRIRNDLTGNDSVRIYTPLTTAELRNPREEDKERARRLIDHLNENTERYHHALWWRMSPDRRYMLLDGFVAPNSGGRSVASVVQNNLIGIVGNSLIMPVSPGYHLDPTYNQDVEKPIDLLEHYQPNTPIDPIRVAIPTRGVYAEAVLGACNSCEVKEEERFWRWEESPIPDSPPAILPTSTDSRRADPPDMTAKDFPSPIIAMQQTPQAPDPTGLGSALSLLGQSGLFKDITGLEGNQRNALEGLKASLATAQAFGDKASNLALQAKMSKDIDKTLRSIDGAKKQGLISDEQAKSLTQGALQSMIGAGPTTDPKPLNTADVHALTQAAGENGAAVKVSRPTGEQIEVDARAPLQDSSTSNRAVIVLDSNTSSANTRAFNPSTHDKSGEVTLGMQTRNAPAGYTLRWIPAEPDALDVVTPSAQSTVVRGKRPGLTRLDLAIYDGGNQIASTQIKMNVPQFISINEDAAFTPILAQLKIDGRKADVLAEAKRTCLELLKTSNARTIWTMAPFSENVPAHISANFVTKATIKGNPPAGSPTLFGQEIPSAAGDGPTVYDETIELFPGAYANSAPAGSTSMVDVESQALLLEIQGTAAPSADLLDFAVKVFGRLIGETLAHEITHSLLGDLIVGGSGHNSPSIANDLMNMGRDRNFTQRTGIEDLAHQSPVVPSNFADHGLASIGHLQVKNQTLIDTYFPVPPKFV